MASKHIIASRSLLHSSSSSPSPSFSSELIEHSTTTFQKSPLYVLEEQQGYRTALEYIQLRVLRDKFTSFMFPPFVMSIAGALMKLKSAHLGLYKARLNSDVVVLSTGGPSKSRSISAIRFVPGSQLSLLWRTPWTYATFGRAYGSAAENRKREVRVSDKVDDDNDGDAGEPSEFEDDDDVEDEQRIEDSDDDDEEEEEDQEPQIQGPAKKKVQIKPPKSKFPDQQGRLLNEKITARTLRLVNDDGKCHRIVSRDEALALAKGKKMDLVLVDGGSNPPVCKIYDFNREEYKQEQILKDRKKKKGVLTHLNEVKELRFNSKTEPKDLKMKAEKAKEFMNRGYRVKFVAIFKGKVDDEKKRLEDEKMIDAIYPLVEDVAAIEQGPRVESRQAWVMLRHGKFASKKKPPKREAQIGATNRVEIVKHEDQVYSEPDFYQGQEENVMHAQNASSVSEMVPMGRLQGYPSKVAASPTQPFTFRSPYEAGHSQVQPAPLQDTVERFSSDVHSPPLHGFPQHTQSLQGFGGSQGSERPVLPPPASMPTFQRAPQQGPPEPSRIQFGPRQGVPWLSQQAPPRYPSPMPSHPQQGPPEPSQIQFGPRQGVPWLSQQAPPRYPSPMPSHPQQTGQTPSQGHQGYFAQEEAQDGGQNYWKSQASQGYPTQQNQAPQGYPPQRGFPQTRLAQGTFGFQGNDPASQGSPSPRGLPQTRPVVPRQGVPWLSQQAPPRYPSPMPSHPQQTGQPPSQGHHGYFAQEEAQDGGQNYWQSQASQGYPTQQNQAPQGYPPQQNQAPQGYPPQRGFPQTRLAQGTFGFQGNYPASQGSPSPRGLPQTRPVVPSPPGFRPSWSTPPQSQEYSPLFESPSDKP